MDFLKDAVPYVLLVEYISVSLFTARMISAKGMMIGSMCFVVGFLWPLWLPLDVAYSLFDRFLRN